MRRPSSHISFVLSGSPTNVAVSAVLKSKMKAYIDRLGNLSINFPNELAIDMVLNSSSGAYKPFVVNFNVHNLNKTLMELHGMLRSM
ncbi:hypothetical protein LXL04_019986 [Taraxacum kok-saghyz]